jgi:tight adherence protein C
VLLILVPLAAFLCVSLLVVAVAMGFSSRAESTAIERRLVEVAPGAVQQVRPAESDYRRAVLAAVKRVGLVAPRQSSELGKLQQRLITAGYRSKEALVYFFGIRLVFAAGLFVLGTTNLVPRSSLLLALGMCALGYVLPGIALARIAKRRQHRIQLALPDALDLLVVSVEAGLGLDQAMQRVSQELTFAHPELCDELRLVNLELRAGSARAEALRNLGTRTDLEDVHSLVTLLVQTDKFGTSISRSLRIHSETLRTKRRQRAEEAAAKIGAKMVFPLVICIFPAIWVVTLGPAIIKFMNVIMPMAQP